MELIIDNQLKQKLNILIDLALYDGHFDIKEKAFIYNVCLRNKIPLDSIGDLIESPGAIGDLGNLSAANRVDYMTACIMLMLIDGKILPREVKFCLDISKRLQFKANLIEAFINELRNNVTIGEPLVRSKIEQLQASA